MIKDRGIRTALLLHLNMCSLYRIYEYLTDLRMEWLQLKKAVVFQTMARNTMRAEVIIAMAAANARRKK